MKYTCEKFWLIGTLICCIFAIPMVIWYKNNQFYSHELYLHIWLGTIATVQIIAFILMKREHYI